MIFGLRSGKGGRTIDSNGSSVAEAEIACATPASAIPRAGVAVAAALVLSMLAGCGGGGGGVVNNSTSTTPGQASGSTATLTGTVIDTESVSDSPDASAVVAFGKYYTVTGANGQFSLAIPAGTSGSLLVYGAAVYSGTKLVIGTNGLPESSNTYINTGYYPASSVNQVELLTTGIPISALASGQTDNLGNIGLLTTNDPPPPPSI